MKYAWFYATIMFLISCAGRERDIRVDSKDTTVLSVIDSKDKLDIQCDTVSFFSLEKYKCSKDFIFFKYIDTTSYKGIRVASGVLKDGSTLQIELITDGDNRAFDIQFFKTNFLTNIPVSKDSIILYFNDEILNLCSILKFKSNIIEKVKCEINNKRGEYNSSNDIYLLNTYGDNFNEISFSARIISYNTVTISALVRDIGDSDQISKCKEFEDKLR